MLRLIYSLQIKEIKDRNQIKSNRIESIKSKWYEVSILWAKDAHFIPHSLMLTIRNSVTQSTHHLVHSLSCLIAYTNSSIALHSSLYSNMDSKARQLKVRAASFDITYFRFFFLVLLRVQFSVEFDNILLETFWTIIPYTYFKSVKRLLRYKVETNEKNSGYRPTLSQIYLTLWV